METVLYGKIWQDLLPNERLAIEHLYYEHPALANEKTGLYRAMHAYVQAKRMGEKTRAKQSLKHALWEVKRNTPLHASNTLMRERARARRKAQATMLNSLDLPTFHLLTPDYLIEAIRQHYRETPLEDLLPEIVFPAAENARKMAEEIQQINAEMQQQLIQHAATAGQKSIVAEATTRPEATEAFATLTQKIIEDVRKKIEQELEKQAQKGHTARDIIAHIHQAIQHYQDTTIPHKMGMLATHFNAKLSEVNQREAGSTHYIWRSQDDESVRSAHAENDDKIFAWDDPPETGHPGHDYNCRCFAQPIPAGAVPANLPSGTPLAASGAEVDTNPAQTSPEDDPSGRADEIHLEDILVPAAILKSVIAGGLRKIFGAVGGVFKNPISKRPKGVPKDWKKTPNKKGEGYTYTDPKVKDGSTYVKVSKGDPKSSNPGQRVDNVRVQKTGQSFDKDGNKVKQQSQESHIPLEEFEKYDPKKFK